MKKHGMGKKLLAALLALAMVLPMMPLRAFAAVGDKQNGQTGLNGDINTEDTTDAESENEAPTTACGAVTRQRLKMPPAEVIPRAIGVASIA